MLIIKANCSSLQFIRNVFKTYIRCILHLWNIIQIILWQIDNKKKNDANPEQLMGRNPLLAQCLYMESMCVWLLDVLL